MRNLSCAQRRPRRSRRCAQLRVLCALQPQDGARAPPFPSVHRYTCKRGRLIIQKCAGSAILCAVACPGAPLEGKIPTRASWGAAGCLHQHLGPAGLAAAQGLAVRAHRQLGSGLLSRCKRSSGWCSTCMFLFPATASPATRARCFPWRADGGYRPQSEVWLPST